MNFQTTSPFTNSDRKCCQILGVNYRVIYSYLSFFTQINIKKLSSQSISNSGNLSYCLCTEQVHLTCPTCDGIDFPRHLLTFRGKQGVYTNLLTRKQWAPVTISNSNICWLKVVLVKTRDGVF